MPIRVTFTICLVVLGYVCLRSLLISISHDEALTYLVHARSSWGAIFFHPGSNPANNHLLNTALVKIFTHFFGPSEFVIRLPAIIGGAITMAASFKILGLFLKKKDFILGQALMITNPLVVDIFSCGRGYSLGLGLYMAALYWIFKRMTADAPRAFKYNALAMAALTLAVLCNISYLNTYPAMLFALIFAQRSGMGHKGRLIIPNLVRQFAAGLLLSELCLLFFYPPSTLVLMKADSAGVGGKSGFWKDTVGSLIQCVLQNKSYALPAVVFSIKIFIGLVLLTGVLILIYLLAKKIDSAGKRYLFLVFFILLVTALTVTYAGRHWGTGYSLDRTAVYFIPLVLLLFLLVWQNATLLLPMFLRRTAYGTGVFLALLMIAHNIFCLNLDNFYIWKYDAATKKVMSLIREAARKEPKPDGQKYRIGVSWLFEPGTNYYIITRNMKGIELTTRKGPDGFYDFYYLLESDKSIIEKYHLKIVAAFDSSQACLAKPD